jgi:hypothetical protein
LERYLSGILVSAAFLFIKIEEERFSFLPKNDSFREEQHSCHLAEKNQNSTQRKLASQ